MRIYVAGPYGAGTEGEREANARRAIEIGVELYRKGHTPFIPHLSHYIDGGTGSLGLGWVDYMAMDLDWLDQCEALFYIGPSLGADLELARARKNGIPVFRSMEEVRV